MRRLASIAGLIALAATAGCGHMAGAGSDPVVMAEAMVPSDPGVQVYVRNKRLASMTTFTAEKTVLFVHGATVPSGIAFDLPLGGESWMDYIAKAGYDVWFVDVRGYGRSTRPRQWISRRSRTRRSRPPKRPSATSARWSTTSCRRAPFRGST